MSVHMAAHIHRNRKAGYMCSICIDIDSESSNSSSQSGRTDAQLIHFCKNFLFDSPDMI